MSEKPIVGVGGSYGIDAVVVLRNIIITMSIKSIEIAFVSGRSDLGLTARVGHIIASAVNIGQKPIAGAASNASPVEVEI